MKTLTIFILVSIAASTGASAIGDWVVSSFEVPADCGYPLGITYDGNYLYISNGLGAGNYSEIYVVTDTGAEVNSYAVGNPLDVINGLTHDGSSIWAVASTPDMIYEVNPADGSNLSLVALDANNATPNSIAFHDNYLYVSNSLTSHAYIYVYNTSGVLQNSFMSFAKYPAGLDIIEDAGTDYIFNLGSDDGYFIVHGLDGTAYPQFTYLTSSPETGNYSGDIVFEQDQFSGNSANMWHINKDDNNIYYLQIDNTGIESASLGEIKALFR